MTGVQKHVSLVETEIRGTLEEHGYKLGPTLGRGSFARCFIVESLKYQTNFVCKVISHSISRRASPNVVKRTYVSEIEALSHLTHPNITAIYDHFEDDQYLYIIMEYCEMGSLDKYLAKHKKVSHAQLTRFAVSLVKGIQYTHNRGFVHLDIKPANLFLTKNGNLKIGDFGLARFVVSSIEKSFFGGSYAYVAPEIIKVQPYDPFLADIWSIGITLFQLSTGYFPWKNVPESQIKIDEILSSPVFSDLILRDVIKACLVLDPSERIKVDELRVMLNDMFQIKSTSVARIKSSTPKPLLMTGMNLIRAKTQITRRLENVEQRTRTGSDITTI